MDVEDPLRNLILNLRLMGIVFMTLLALVPWRLLRTRTLGQLAIWLPIPVLAVGLIYEAVMPAVTTFEWTFFSWSRPTGSGRGRPPRRARWC